MTHTLMTQIKKLQQINSNWKYEDEYGYIVDQDTGETICQQSDKKRGKLMAGAPELLRTLKMVHNVIAEGSRIDPKGGFYHSIGEAIKQATE